MDKKSVDINDYMKGELKNNKRYEWVDVLKALGIMAIYLGHSVNHNGKLHLFLYTYHVPLFFFASGFFSVGKRKVSLWEYIKKKFCAIMIPYFGFSLIYTIAMSIVKKEDLTTFLIIIRQIIFGIRNQIPADSLWFLPCLFIMSIIYEILYRIFKSKKDVLICSIILFFITQIILPQNPLSSPSYFLNIDSAMYYVIYYAIGSIVFNYLKEFNYESLSGVEKKRTIIVTIVCLIVAFIVFIIGRDKILSYIGLPSLINAIIIVVVALIMIYLNLILASVFEKIYFLQKLGKSTLILCGTEQLIRGIFKSIFIYYGYNLDMATTFQGILYTIFSLTLSYFFVIPFVNKFFPNFRVSKNFH